MINTILVKRRLKKAAIPLFPDFDKIRKKHELVIDKYADEFPYSTFSFTNLLLWDLMTNREIAHLDSNLVLLLHDYDTNEPFLTFAGRFAPTTTIHKLLNYAKQTGISEELRYVPEEIATRISSDDVVVKADTDNFDYVYDLKKIADPTGNKLKTKRNRARFFKRTYPHAQFSVTTLKESDIEEIEQLFQTWKTQTKSKRDNESDTSHEERAIHKLYEIYDARELLFSSVRVRRKLVAFSVDEVMNKNYAVGHFVKADRECKGVYEFINERTAQVLLTYGVKYWNWQQDLGIPGLRDFKRSYRPDHFMKKYTVSLSNK